MGSQMKNTLQTQHKYFSIFYKIQHLFLPQRLISRKIKEDVGFNVNNVFTLIQRHFRGTSEAGAKDIGLT